jgi:hypothetical protein
LFFAFLHPAQAPASTPSRLVSVAFLLKQSE